METKSKHPSEKRKDPTNLLMEAATYREPLRVTKVMVYSDNTAYPLCPRCSMCLEREYVPFCDQCGQKLSWRSFSRAKICRPNFYNK